jgi:hypothetical protein
MRIGQKRPRQISYLLGFGFSCASKNDKFIVQRRRTDVLEWLHLSKNPGARHASSDPSGAF